MSKLVIIAVFIFWGAISIFYANSLFQKNNVSNNQNINNGQANTLAAQLSLHNSKNDCWLAIDNKVYNVTDYIYTHPGGAGEIIKYCGQEASKAFLSKDKLIPQEHSAQAYAMLAAYYIGDLNSVSTSNNNKDNTASTTDSNSNTDVSVTYTVGLVAQHKIATDCWVTAGSNVYNVTSYIKSHPGGQGNITKYCGSDIAAAFASQGHSANANNIFANYKIGTIGSAVSSSNNAIPTNNPVNTPSNNTNTTPSPTNLTLTTALVAQHKIATDCWVIAGNNVYNVTSYIRSHPGGQSNITKYCGADIAAAFAGQGHSANASNIFANYKIGTLGSSVSTDIVNTPPVNTNQNTGANDDDEEDD